MQIRGAWLTDIDDTLVGSGEMPSENFIGWLAGRIRILMKHNIYWTPMSGVAMDKLGPRILYRLPEDILSNIIYYSGDGSQKYTYNGKNDSWEEDRNFTRLFTGVQTETVISIIDRFKIRLKENGYNPEKSETYFRGGSVSWMMLGDISAEPYHEPKAAALRQELIETAKKILKENNYLRYSGDSGITVPFPGARGIKFVLEGNDKERGARDLIEKYGIKPKHILFAGNELFTGGNDNMIRNIPGITLLSVGRREDPGEKVVAGRIESGKGTVTDTDANRKWLNWTCGRLELGYGWEGVLHTMTLLGSRIFTITDKVNSEKVRRKSPSHKEIGAVFFDKGGTLSLREPFNDNGVSDIKKIMSITGAKGSLKEFHDLLIKRDNQYKNWSLETLIEADEEEIWTRWMLPEYPPELTADNAVKLTLLFSHSKGTRKFRTEAYSIIRELYSRGYRIGIVSNTVSRVLVPGEIEETGLAEYIETLIMSSMTNIRKPDPGMFRMAAEIMKISPERSAYIGDKPNRDVEGPRRAGYKLTIVLNNSKLKPVKDLSPIQRPDIVINGFKELLEIFP
ncbi:MAG: HAD family hydrolase [Spirochaetes bacterium]|nr:HAD family hydrolase [Spirochaetota bacterium]